MIIASEAAGKTGIFLSIDGAGLDSPNRSRHEYWRCRRSTTDCIIGIGGYRRLSAGPGVL